MQSIIKTAHSNSENMKNFATLLNTNIEKKAANDYISAFITQTEEIAKKSSRQGALWKAFSAIAIKINVTCNQVNTLYEYDREVHSRSEHYANHTRELFQKYMQDLEKLQQHYPKKAFAMFSEMMAIIAEKYDQISKQEDVDIQRVDHEIGELIEESRNSVMLLLIYTKLGNNSTTLKEVITEITRNHKSTDMKQQYNLTDKEIRLLIDLEIERRQQADRKEKKEILRQYKKDVKEKRSEAAKKWYPSYGRYKTAAAILGDCLLIVAPLINIFRFIRSGGGLWGEFNPVFSSKAHQDFEKSLPQQPIYTEEKNPAQLSTTYKIFNDKLLSKRAANQPTMQNKTNQPNADLSTVNSIIENVGAYLESLTDPANSNMMPMQNSSY